MSFFSFLEEKAAEMLFQMLFLAMVIFLLVFYGVDKIFIVLLAGFFIGIQGIFQGYLYRKAIRAARSVIDLADSSEESYYISEILPKPKEIQNKAYYYALKKD